MMAPMRRLLRLLKGAVRMTRLNTPGSTATNMAQQVATSIHTAVGAAAAIA